MTGMHGEAHASGYPMSDTKGDAMNRDDELLELDRRIDKEDGLQADAFRAATLARWEFGRRIKAERDANGGKRLPQGRMAELCALTGKKDRELNYRMQFAELCPTETEVSQRVAEVASWREVVKSFAPSRDASGAAARGSSPRESTAIANEVDDSRLARLGDAELERRKEALYKESCRRRGIPLEPVTEAAFRVAMANGLSRETIEWCSDETRAYVRSLLVEAIDVVDSLPRTSRRGER